MTDYYNPVGKLMDHNKENNYLEKQMKKATKEVKSWPKWKQELMMKAIEER